MKVLKREAVAAVFALLTGIVYPADGVWKWDARMAESGSVIDTNGVKWIDGRFLPLEGKAFQDVESFYDRLPAIVSTNINGGVRSMKHHTSGMIFRFSSDSRFLLVRMTPYEKSKGVYHMTELGCSGFDVYHKATNAVMWRFLGSSHLSQVLNVKTSERQKLFDWIPGEECTINLPLYNGVKVFQIGIEPNATIRELPPRKSGVTKPVVFYGTSITQGGCATRPGLGFVNIIGRKYDLPVVGLGFSGSGFMEFEMSDMLARIDASCYVLDCLWNMVLAGSRKSNNVDSNYERFVRNLRTKRPNVPIIMAARNDVLCAPGEINRFSAMNKYVFSLYEKFVKEGMAELYYVPAEDMYSGDSEGTVDAVHPNDLGMMTIADAFAKYVKKALNLK